MKPDQQTEIPAGKVAGSFLGLAFGDALGAPFEGRSTVSPDEVRYVAENHRLLRYTDDTHMAIGVAESLIACRGFNGEHMAKTFVRNFLCEPWRGYAPGPPGVFRRIESGVPWYRASEEVFPGGSYGNGAAMRIAPVGLLYYRSPEKIRKVAYLCSQITHAHILAKEGAALIAAAVASAAVHGPGRPTHAILEYLIAFTTIEAYRNKLRSIYDLAVAKDRVAVVQKLGNGVEAINSVPTAIYCFVAHGKSFVDSIIEAISMGGDCDTIAAMTGAIAGAWWGEEAIPATWLNKLENFQYIRSLAHKLHRLTSELSRNLLYRNIGGVQ